jgi:23S rRNA pseudouridine1911/1915/1917 synthase
LLDPLIYKKVGDEPDKTLWFDISGESQEVRLDVFVSSKPIGLSRSRVQTLIKNEHIKVNNHPSKASYKLRKGDQVNVWIPPAVIPNIEPENIKFELIHEDSSLIVLNKPPGLVVHPAPGHDTGTLVHGILNLCKDLSGIGGVLRPGIVHRLDKDTSGLMVVAKNDKAHSFLAKQFKAGEVKKQYIALVHGRLKEKRGIVDLPIARHPVKRKKMAVVKAGGKRAVTIWNEVERFRSGFSLLALLIKTGRTHQIRVHLSHLGYPIVGDSVYGYGKNWWKRNYRSKNARLPVVNRQMLHAKCLGFHHPEHREYQEFEVPLPDDMNRLMEMLKSADS